MKYTLLHSKNVYAFNFSVNDILHYHVESITENGVQYFIYITNRFLTNEIMLC